MYEDYYAIYPRGKHYVIVKERNYDDGSTTIMDNNVAEFENYFDACKKQDELNASIN